MPCPIPIDLAKLEELRNEYGTPFQLYDEKLITERVNYLNSTFRQYFPEFVNYFAVKALPNPAILKLLDTLGSGFDCSSSNEVEIISRLGIDGSRIMFTSNFTSKKDLKKACEKGVIVNLDDISLLDSIENMPELISFRLNPGVGRTDSATVSNVLGGPSAKFGVAKTQIIAAYEKAKKLGAKRFGIHMMTGSCVTNSEYCKQTVTILLNTIKEANEKLRIQFEFINIGGGLGIPYKLNQEVAELNTVAQTISNVFESFFKEHGDTVKRPKLMMENGRYITGPFGWLVSTCEAVKRNDYGIYYGLDACMANLMRPGMYNSYHHITVAGRSTVDNEVADEVANVVGTLCENNDWFARDRKLPKSQVGDMFIIHDTGAHAHSMGFNYNAKLRAPELLLRTDGSVDLIRTRETFDTLFANTILPSDLKFAEPNDKIAAKQALKCLDLTSLGLDDTNEIILALCQKAKTRYGQVAALCVYPKFIKFVKDYLSTNKLDGVEIATVVNFPSGSEDIEGVCSATREAVTDGADEVDLVINYKKVYEFLKAGGKAEEKAKLVEDLSSFVAKVKEACGKSKLKVIIESGFFEDNLSNSQAEEAITICCEASIAGGCDFLKTSTGKVPTNATLTATKLMLTCIKATGKKIGFKAAGGIRKVSTARDYIQLQKEILGEEFLSPEYFRVGASSLLNDILAVLDR